MATMAVNGIILKQSISAKGGAFVTLADLDTGGTIRISLRDKVLSDAQVADKSPYRLILQGVELRGSRNGDYLICTDIAGEATPSGKARS